ncbi:hypothetical protein DAPPUDRAFT_311129 [Daphnia pulex]|uniref:Uncharacterized protein n=1 Tax=Daphnia pulex TaxID=6669 RepID=E9FUS0_DAPPU|nr:hypothetical protein DAPPUDRAFT_311129 [Daphnia pulex]|eukprot:EFX88875.1 hypothetical protein DAPPUDRAFT_311129 [Daphnia pulex]
MADSKAWSNAVSPASTTFTYLEASRFGSHAAHHVNLIFAMLLLEPGTFHENTELHFSHPIQVLQPIVQTARKSRLALL